MPVRTTTSGGKAIRITFSECVFIALVIHALCYIVMFCSTLSPFYHTSEQPIYLSNYSDYRLELMYFSLLHSPLSTAEVKNE